MRLASWMLVSLALAGARVALADKIVVAGGGAKQSDCYVGFTVGDDRPVTQAGVTVTQKACGGSCTFRVQACSQVPVIGCNAPALASASGRAGKFGSLESPPSRDAASCGHATAITLTPKGKHAKKQKVTLVGVAVTGTKPKKDTDKLVLACTPNPSDDGCTDRIFTIGANSHIFAGLLGPDQPAEITGTANGTLVLSKGTPGSDDVATLTLASDAVLGLQVLDNSYACLKMEAAGSSGKIDCDGGTPVDVVVTGDSHEDTDHHNDPPTVLVEQGAPGAAGSAYLRTNARFVNCADDGSHDGVAGGCLAVFTNGSADCADPTKVDFSKAKLLLNNGVSTTGTATTMILHPVGGGTAIVKTGQPFDCAHFAGSGTGILETPAMFYDFSLIHQDVTAMLQLGE